MLFTFTQNVSYPLHIGVQLHILAVDADVAVNEISRFDRHIKHSRHAAAAPLQVHVRTEPVAAAKLVDDAAHAPLDVRGRRLARNYEVRTESIVDDGMRDLAEAFHDLLLQRRHALEPAHGQVFPIFDARAVARIDGIFELLKERGRKAVAEAGPDAAVHRNSGRIALLQNAGKRFPNAFALLLHVFIQLVHFRRLRADAHLAHRAGRAVAMECQNTHTARFGHVPGDKRSMNGIFVVFSGKDDPEIEAGGLHRPGKDEFQLIFENLRAEHRLLFDWIRAVGRKTVFQLGNQFLICHSFLSFLQYNQLFVGLCQIDAAVFRDENVVFDPDPAKLRDVNARLGRDDHAGLQRNVSVFILRALRRFVDVQAKIRAIAGVCDDLSRRAVQLASRFPGRSQ